LEIADTKTKAGLVSALVACVALLVTGCGGGQDRGQMTIAYQPGIGYAQLLIIKQEGWLEEDLPETEISWEQLSSGAAIRDGMIAGDIQVGSGGTGPFLVGYDSGVEWKVLSALNEMDLWLMVLDEQLQSLADFGDGRIAMPAPDSIQSVVLRRGAEEQLGDARVLDSNIVALAHPDGLQALLSGQIAGHLTSPPFQFQEQDQGARPILRSFDLFGPHTFNSVFVLQEYHDDNPENMETLYNSIQRATELIQDDPDAAAEILSAESGNEMSAEEFERFITEEGVAYTTQPREFITFAEFMQQTELLRNVPESCEELVYDNLSAEHC
jgi:NitT/TauT family transport system substrate-binding protein